MQILLFWFSKTAALYLDYLHRQDKIDFFWKQIFNNRDPSLEF